MCDNESELSANLALRIKSSGLLPSDTTFPFNNSSPALPSQVSQATLAEYQQRLQLYDYAAQAALRFRLSQHAALGSNGTASYNLGGHPALAEAASSFSSISPFGRYDPRFRFMHEEPKPQHSYIGLIAMAILSAPEHKMVLSDIYQHILDHYPYFRNRGPGWRNSIRHNLSLNDCFVKAGRSANGKGHYWAIHPANIDDFKKGDFRRRKAQRKVRKHMGLSVPDDEDSQSPVSTPTPRGPMFDQTQGNPLHLLSQGPPMCGSLSLQDFCFPLAHFGNQLKSDRILPIACQRDLPFQNIRAPSGNSKRMFDVESLLAPDSDASGAAKRQACDRSPLSTHSPRDDLPDSNCSSPSISSSGAQTPPIATSSSELGNKAGHVANDSNSGVNAISTSASYTSQGLTSWQAAQIQSLHNLHQINASLFNQSLRPTLPMWASATGFRLPPTSSFYAGYSTPPTNDTSMMGDRSNIPDEKH